MLMSALFGDALMRDIIPNGVSAARDEAPRVTYEPFSAPSAYGPARAPAGRCDPPAERASSCSSLACDSMTDPFHSRIPIAERRRALASRSCSCAARRRAAGAAHAAPSLDEALQPGRVAQRGRRCRPRRSDPRVGNRYITRSQAMPQLSGTGGYTKTLKSQFEVLAEPAPDPNAPEVALFARIPANATAGASATRRSRRRSTCQSGRRLRPQRRRVRREEPVGARAERLVQCVQRRTHRRTDHAPPLAQERAATIEVDAQRAQVKLDVAQAYFDAALADRLVSIAQSSLATTELVLTQTKLGAKSATSRSSTSCAPR